MSLFIDKQKRRKSPLALAAFGATLLYLCVFGALYALLAEPLHNHIQLGGASVTVAVHGTIIAVAGTALCCLLFFLTDKRVAPLGFAGLAVALGMFYVAALMLEGEVQDLMLRLITMYGLAPVVVGNAAAWPIYLKIKQGAPAAKRKKTVQQELMEAAVLEAARQERKRSRQAKRSDVASSTTSAPEKQPFVPPPSPTPEEVLFGPQAGGGPGSSRSAEEEAMLLYVDDGDDMDDYDEKSND